MRWCNRTACSGIATEQYFEHDLRVQRQRDTVLPTVDLFCEPVESQSIRADVSVSAYWRQQCCEEPALCYGLHGLTYTQEHSCLSTPSHTPWAMGPELSLLSGRLLFWRDLGRGRGRHVTDLYCHPHSHVLSLLSLLVALACVALLGCNHA